MKSRFISIIALMCIGGLIALWRTQQKPPEVITIYKTVAYQPKQVRTTKRAAAQTADILSPVSDLSETSAGADTERLAAAHTSPEEDPAFSEGFDALEAELATETLNEELDGAADTASDIPTEIPYWKLSKMVKAVYDMEEVLNEYGIYVDEIGKDVCPKCGTYNFHILRSRTDDPEEWACMECAWPGGDVIGFVAWMEDVDGTEAARFLAERAGIIASGVKK